MSLEGHTPLGQIVRGGGGGTSCATTPVHVYHGCTYKANFLYYLPLFCVYKALLYRMMAEIHGHGHGGRHPSWDGRDTGDTMTGVVHPIL